MSNKPKRAKYTNEFKSKVIDHASITSFREAARHFTLDESVVRRWCHKRAKSLGLPSGAKEVKEKVLSSIPEISDKPKRTAYTLKFKSKVIDHADITSYREAARHFELNESVVRRWYNKKGEILSLASATINKGDLKKIRTSTLTGIQRITNKSRSLFNLSSATNEGESRKIRKSKPTRIGRISHKPRLLKEYFNILNI